MRYTFAKTIWPPTPIDPAIKNLIERYYVLADFNGPEAGKVLADEVFTETGTMMSPLKTFSGSEEIRASLQGSAGPILSRRHEILKVYIGDEKGHDLMLIGKNEVSLRNGKEVFGDFAARMVVDDASVNNGNPRLRFSRVWTDTAPLIAAMKET